MKIKKLRLANVEVVSNPRLQNRKILGIARIFALAATVVALSAHELLAFTVNQTRVLPFPNQTVSTIPSNGDVNPYGVAFVPEGFPTGGKLNPGDLLVSNFNDANNIQGTGTTIVNISGGSTPFGCSFPMRSTGRFPVSSWCSLATTSP
jgi:hypothetical protein